MTIKNVRKAFVLAITLMSFLGSANAYPIGACGNSVNPTPEQSTLSGKHNRLGGPASTQDDTPPPSDDPPPLPDPNCGVARSMKDATPVNARGNDAVTLRLPNTRKQ